MARENVRKILAMMLAFGIVFTNLSMATFAGDVTDWIDKQNGNQKREDHRQRHGDQRKGGRVGRCPSKGHIPEKGSEVRQSNEIAGHGIVHHTVINHHQKGDEEEDADTDKAGHKEPPGAAHLSEPGLILTPAVLLAVDLVYFRFRHNLLFL